MARNIDMIVVHCSDSRWGDTRIIDEWHKQRGWSGIGYHAVICNGLRLNSRDYFKHCDGLLLPGRDQSKTGAHVRGYNKNSLGVCLIGIDVFTDQQFKTLRKLIDIWRALYDVPIEKVVGHYELDSHKTCPNFNVNEWLDKGK